MDELEPFIGEWAMAATFPNAPTIEDPGARSTFEWMAGRQFLIQRFRAPDPSERSLPGGLVELTYRVQR